MSHMSLPHNILCFSERSDNMRVELGDIPHTTKSRVNLLVNDAVAGIGRDNAIQLF